MQALHTGVVKRWLRPTLFAGKVHQVCADCREELLILVKVLREQSVMKRSERVSISGKSGR